MIIVSRSSSREYYLAANKTEIYCATNGWSTSSGGLTKFASLTDMIQKIMFID